MTSALRGRPRLRGPVLRAALAAGALSGLPSTAIALGRRSSPLEAARAAGALVGRPSLARGLLVHAAVSAAWALVLDAVLPDRALAAGEALTLGLAAGTAICLLDLGLVGRRFPEIAALPTLPQVADHLCYGLVAVVVLRRS